MIRFPTDWLKVSFLLVFIGSVSAQEKGPVSTSEAAGKTPQVSREPTKAKLPESGGEVALPRPANASAGQDKKTDQPEAPRVSTGRRDPFRPFTMTPRGSARRENLTPLERYELGQLKLVAVIWNLKEPNALVEDSVGLGYIVKAGTPIGTNDGKVKLIKPGEIIIEETYIDVYGAKKKREVSMLLNVETAQ